MCHSHVFFVFCKPSLCFCLQRHLYKLFAAIHFTLLKDLHKAPVYSGLQACIPFAILIEGFHGSLSVSKNDTTYQIFCLNCFITNCVNLTMSPGTFVVVHQPPCLLPVNLSRPWYDDLGIYAMETIANLLSALLQPWYWVLLPLFLSLEL